MEMAEHDHDVALERELDIDHLAERVIAVTRSAREGTPHVIQAPHPRRRSPSFEVVAPRPAIPALLPMTDAEMTKCMRPFAKRAKFDESNPCTVVITAPTFFVAAAAVIDVLEYANASQRDFLFEAPQGVTVSDISEIQPISFMDVRTCYEVYAILPSC